MSDGSRNNNLLLCISLLSFFTVVSKAAFNRPTISFDEGYSPLFADFNIKKSDDGRTANLHLNRHAGSGFISSKYYDYGFFSSKIKLPGNYTAGVVVAFYTSNGDVWEKSHDELDIEFLGNVKGKPWRFQTNMYGNGSTNRGREERYRLWFDPTKDFHEYSILWTRNNIIFYVDNVPIREIVRNEAMGSDYPSKPMSLYATIWDASSWATDGGKYSVKYEFEPFVSEFTDFVLEGCPVDPLEQIRGTISSSDCTVKKEEIENKEYSQITPSGQWAMKWFRERYMYYSYCYDKVRYPVPPPECTIVPSEQARFKETGRLKFGSIPKRQRKRRGRARKPINNNNNDEYM
ncbi:probable xyloglucan endotransglucosylase/hydrolase protein 30 [Amaranthus tricolor]|uniref:probable xyloglucan endotransglucosylase/hydrolase protein 30 n=1 Tax=Amaranthus tricolor TaxID=29722 RepID=UPI00258C73C3|nr:probable xyloglucan endotransglucosylase/hydrolase protein 30 [Amaranthus tricolor]